MIGSEQQQSASTPHRRRPSRLAISALAATLVFAGSLAAVALAAGPSVTIGSASNSTLGQITINSAGRTLYTLSGETTHHLKCTTSECFKFWPPVEVPSRTTKLKAGPGVSGHLGILRRSNGVLQVTLRGLPLYRFSKDHAKGETNGQDVKSFGGTWHAMPAGNEASTPAPSAPSSPTPTTPTTPEMPYGY
jgi:predicted lipoprotein with Yx(FWY)xxD motif